MIKKLWSDLKNQAGSSWAIVLVVMLLIVLSFGIASLSSQVIKVKPGLAQTKDIVMNPPEIGWCLYMDGPAKLDKLVSLGDKTARQQCEDKNKENNSFGTGKKIWLAFCVGDNGCNGATPNVEKSPRLENIIGSRDSLIDKYNSGTNFFDPTRPSDFNDLALIQAASFKRFNCSIIPSDILAKKRTSKPLKASVGGAELWQIGAGPIDPLGTYRYKSEGVIIGTRELIQEYAKLRSKMLTFNDDTFQCQDTWPKSRTVNGQKQACFISSSYRSESTNSNHGKGQAMDIACTLPASTISSGETCTGIAKEMVDAIEDAGSGFNIIRECSRAERKKYGDGSISVQVIHLEI